MSGTVFSEVGEKQLEANAVITELIKCGVDASEKAVLIAARRDVVPYARVARLK